MTLCNFIILLIVSVVSDDNINRRIFTNYRGNAQHDGYLKFGESTFKFPLTSIWNVTANPYFQADAVFVNNTFYCINTVFIPSDQTFVSTIYSINSFNGEILWKNSKLILPESLTYSTSKDMGYLCVYDDGDVLYNGSIYILNPENGTILNQIPFPSAQPPAITAYNGLFYVFNSSNDDLVHYRLSLIDPIQGKIINSIQIPPATPKSLSYVQPPTFCMNGEIIVLYDVFNLFAAFNSTTFELLWLDIMSVKDPEQKWAVPPICIEPDKILMVDELNDWQIVDAKTGKNFTSIYLGEYNDLQPPVYHPDKQILIRDDQWDSTAVSAMNISDPDPANWNKIWTVQNADDDGDVFMNAMIVDDSLILTDQGLKLKVYDINNGKLLWEYDFAQYNTYFDIGIIPGIDINGDAVLIVQWSATNVSQIYAFR